MCDNHKSFKKFRVTKHKMPICFVTPKFFYATLFGVATHSLRSPDLRIKPHGYKQHTCSFTIDFIANNQTFFISFNNYYLTTVSHNQYCCHRRTSQQRIWGAMKFCSNFVIFAGIIIFYYFMDRTKNLSKIL